uniref:ANF_receptor domain-containing protein n=1 Tax=Elaeophora elaphi TaxID=1147741 RepID=A0A158Q912_9BILA
MDDQTKLLVGLVCSDAELVEYYVQLITEIKRFTLKAIWCPDTERSIDIAANNDVPSVSHTAFQLISRNDTNAVVITGHAAHNALFCVQAQALKKKAICIGAAALSEQTAHLLVEFSEKYLTFLQIIYPLKYSTPMALIMANIAKIGLIQSISAEVTFEQPQDAKHRLYNECNTVLHQISHELLDALSAICGCDPTPIATTCHQRSSVVEHFRLQELQCVLMQVAFGNAVACIRITVSTAKTLVLRITGKFGFFLLDTRMLILEGREGQGVLWRGDGTMESIIRTGIVKGLENCDCSKISADTNELSLVQCVSKCRFI